MPEVKTRTPRPRRVKRGQWTRVHRWTGFALMAWFVFEAVTGSYLAVADDLARWTSPGEYRHTTGDVGPAAAAESAEAKVQKSHAETILFPQENHGIYTVVLKDDAGDRLEAHVDPGTGKVNDVTDPDHGFFVTVLRLHANFNTATILGVSAVKVVGFLGIAWLVNVAAGFWIMRRRRRALRPSWAFRKGRRPRAFHLAVHNWVGLAIFVPLVVAVVTGIAFQFPGQSDAVTNALLPGSTTTDVAPQVPYSTPSVDGRRAGLDAVTEAVKSADVGPIRSIVVPLGNPAGVFTADVDGGGYSPRSGTGRDITVYADQYSGQVLSVVDPIDRSAAFKVSNDWLPGLHFGFFAGWVSKILWLFIGIGTVALGVTGLGMRRGRFPWQKKRSGRLPQPAGPVSVQSEVFDVADDPAPVMSPALDERKD